MFCNKETFLMKFYSVSYNKLHQLPIKEHTNINNIPLYTKKNSRPCLNFRRKNRIPIVFSL